jgi:hypothetical protein
VPDITFTADELDRYVKASGAIKDEMIFEDGGDTQDGGKTVDLGGKDEDRARSGEARRGGSRSPRRSRLRSPPPRRRRSARPPRSTRAAGPAVDPIEADSGVGTGVVVGSLVTTIFMLLATFVVLDIGRDNASSLTDGIASFCLEKFGRK